MFVTIVPLAFSMIRKHLRYEIWYFIHFTLYIAIILVFDHQIQNGQDFANPYVLNYWKILFYATFINIIYYRFIKPTYRSLRYGFRVDGLKMKTGDVCSVYITGRNLEKLRASAGQFVIVRFLAKDFLWEAHPFSLSEMPNGRRLRLSIKASGDFTKKIPTLPIDTKILLEGPLGRFTADRAQNNKVLLIAGGIGITPLRALFEEFTIKGTDVKLIYAARSIQDFALKDELDKLGKVFYTTERLTPGFIKNNVHDVISRFIYLCGPPPMIQIVREQLTSIGVPSHSILYEKFQFG